VRAAASPLICSDLKLFLITFMIANEMIYTGHRKSYWTILQKLTINLLTYL